MTTHDRHSPGPSIGSLLRILRQRAQLTQEQLATRSGLGVRTIRRLEADGIRTPRFESVRLLAHALKLTDEERAQLVAAVHGESQTTLTPTARSPRQLPADVPGFTGRTAQLGQLDALLAGDGPSTCVVISAIAGTAGVGKTALAVHWGQQVADWFPDGQLYLNLRGFDPSGLMMAPAEAIRTLLDAFEVPPQRIPASLDAQVALYRTLLAGRRVLVLLDNVRNADQVRPLLPGSPGCLAVVTSRNQLTSLVATHGAHPIALDIMPVVEARELLARRLGAERVMAEPEAVEEIITGCARLPLALAIAAARAALNQRLPLRSLAQELRDERNQLDALDAGDSATNMRAVFSWSYQRLDKHVARMFRLLGLHPGPDISLPASASLAGICVDRARDALSELTRTHLVSEHAPGRYTFHDLLRRYATEMAGIHDTDDERHAALRRVLDHYLHAAHAAARLLNPHRISITPATAEPDVVFVRVLDHEQAMTWFTEEHAALVAVVQLAAQSGFEVHAWQLAWTLVDFLDRRGHWQEWISTQITALQAACQIADREAQAHSHRGLGRALARAARHDEARGNLRRAVDLFGELGDRTGQARTHLDLSWLMGLQHRGPEALVHAQAALDLYQAIGEPAGQARALNSVGWCHAVLGEYHRTLDHCQRALSLHQRVGDRGGEAATWDSLGYAHHNLGDHAQAVHCYQRALALRQELGDRHNEADALTQLGDAHRAAGDLDAARDAWRHALHILNELHHPDTNKVSAKLFHLDHTHTEAGAER